MIEILAAALLTLLLPLVVAMAAWFALSAVPLWYQALAAIKLNRKVKQPRFEARGRVTPGEAFKRAFSPRRQAIPTAVLRIFAKAKRKRAA